MSTTARQVLDRAAAWQRVNATERRLAARELPNVETARALRYLRMAFAHAHRCCVPQPTSGLIEQQRWFRKLHGC